MFKNSSSIRDQNLLPSGETALPSFHIPVCLVTPVTHSSLGQTYSLKMNMEGYSSGWSLSLPDLLLTKMYSCCSVLDRNLKCAVSNNFGHLAEISWYLLPWLPC